MNILKTIAYIHDIFHNDSKINYVAKLVNNSAQQKGKIFESFIERAFSGSLLCNEIEAADHEQLENNKQAAFCYTGSANNPPDLVLRHGDAIEVKQSSGNGDLALNSSYPKHKLYHSDTRINAACRRAISNESPDWQERDIIYAVGTMPKQAELGLKRMWLVYGDIYAAPQAVYTDLFAKIKTLGLSHPDVAVDLKTNELGRINGVDGLGITYLRLRGMWGLKHPEKVYSYLCKVNKNAKFELFCLMREEKFLSFPLEDREKLESLGIVADVLVNDPGNIAKQLKAKKLHFYIA
jgi:hypothetical protein